MPVASPSRREPQQVCVPVYRPPQTDDELWHLVRAMWGVRIPRMQVCRTHQAPFDAFANAYFARDPLSVWKASRGFGGKSTLLAVLALTEQVCLGARVSILGGSGTQAQRVHDEMTQAWHWPGAPRELLQSDPARMETRLTNGGRAQALMASQASIRGPHPQRLRIDEADNLELSLFDAALGQPMRRGGIETQIVVSSTHQNPDGTMTEILRRADAQHNPVFAWCYKETMQPHGWLDPAEVEAARRRIPAQMFEVEFDLQEPAFEARAMLAACVETAFTGEIGTGAGALGEYLEWEPPPGPRPAADAPYVTGTDWAKEQDFTVIVTFRTDELPWRVVAFERLGRCPWPEMVQALDARLARYGGLSMHDATGVGNVVHDYLYTPSTGITLVGERRKTIFRDYIAAIERGDLLWPRLDYAHLEHKYCRTQDLFGAGHPPDSVVAGALAWAGRTERTQRWEVW
jgi:hypothetical protein